MRRAYVYFEKSSFLFCKETACDCKLFANQHNFISNLSLYRMTESNLLWAKLHTGVHLSKSVR